MARRVGASFVSTLRPTAGQRRSAWAVGWLSLLVFLAAAPFAQMPLAPVPAFLPLYQSALIVFDLITSVLLLGQYRMLRSRGLLYLAAGYFFSAFMATAHALSFPGLFSSAGLIGSGPQTTAWLYFAWHAGFALFILAYAIAGSRKNEPSAPSAAGGIFASLMLAAISAAVPIVFATRHHDFLPPIMDGSVDAPGKIVVATATWLVGVASWIVLWRRRSHTVLDLWLMVVLCVWIADTALASMLNHGRFDLGWYAGRAYGLLANGFVLAVLLLENGSLYARVARSNRLLGHAMGELRRLNGDLQAFAGSLAHDLQQPLTTISAYAQVIERSPLPEREAAHVRRIIGATESAHRMVRGLLEFARLGESPLHTGPVDLNETLAQARSIVAADGRAGKVTWNVARLPVVQGDGELLLLAFVNLLSNALKYSRTREQPVITVDAAPKAPDGWAIRIADNGVGFDPSQVDRLFTPFERLHPESEFEGTGMGLANVRKIVERHGGSVHAQSQPGEGAVFTLELRRP
jgi:signal transduction histidine kinase